MHTWFTRLFLEGDCDEFSIHKGEAFSGLENIFLRRHTRHLNQFGAERKVGQERLTFKVENPTNLKSNSLERAASEQIASYQIQN